MAFSEASGTAVVGLDVGGSKALVHVVASDGRLLGVERRATGRRTSPGDLIALIERVVDRARLIGPIASVGVGFPGLADVERGCVLSSVILDGWRDVPLAQLVEERLGLPCAVDNDVNNAARAELVLRGADGGSMLFVSVGSGVGGAVVLKGRVWTGVRGLAGEIGHVAVDGDGPRCRCGRLGCVGPRASGHALASRLGVDPEEAAKLASAGDPAAWAILGEGAALLGRAIANALNLLNLPLVVIGGGVAELGARYLALIDGAVRREAFAEVAGACRIESARAGYEAGAAGAALLAVERLKAERGSRRRRMGAG